MRSHITRRQMMRMSVAIAAAGLAGDALAAPAEDGIAAQAPATDEAVTRPTTTASHRPIAAGPFEATWESLVAHYRVPDWFRDAKFGIWSHWSAQCVPEQGDWYGRNMYLQGHPQYEHHVNTYGHPSRFGLMEMQNLWKAERWEPEKLIALYKRAGAKYFFALANHHDNFDAYDSEHHAWNSVRVGPRRDIVGDWQRAARAAGLRFGVSNHSSWAARWLQVAYGYDGEGPLAGVRYDAATRGSADGRGTWWEGLDPQDLYTGNSVPMPPGLRGAAAVRDWHAKNTSLGRDNPYPAARFVENWYDRCKDLVDKYQPDVLYFDTNELPLEQAGLDVVAHYYNASVARSGRVDVVVNGKHVRPGHVGAFVEDIERGVAGGLRDDPWQIDTCIGQWHYSRAVADANAYKTVGQVVCMLADVVSKNGNLMLSVPMRGDGTIDGHEQAFLEGMAAWMDVNGEAIFGTRPWTTFGEGPTKTEGREQVARAYTPQDVRFTTKDATLYAIVMSGPGGAGRVRIASLATGSAHVRDARVRDVRLLGHAGKLEWTHDAQGLSAALPPGPGGETIALKIEGLLPAT